MTRHGYLPLPSLLGDGDKGIEIVYSEEKIFCIQGRLWQPRQLKNLLFRHDKPNKPIKKTKEGPLSFVLFESPFTSVSTVSRGHPSL
jgi:hypothetical protein